MNTLDEIAKNLGFILDRRDTCCPDKAYKGDKVFATVRASSTMRQVFFDGRTLTTGAKTKYATFPRPDAWRATVEAMEELAEKHPVTRNRYITLDPSVLA
jgi:hypothetical protein